MDPASAAHGVVKGLVREVREIDVDRVDGWMHERTNE